MTNTIDHKGLPIEVVLHEDGTYDVSVTWDETHPVAIELGLDDWSEQQWLDVIAKACKRDEEVA